MTDILAFDMKEHMVVFQKTLGKDHKARQCRLIRKYRSDK